MNRYSKDCVNAIFFFMPRLENLWATPVLWNHGTAISNVSKPHCFNGFQVARNMLNAAFWSPAEPAWDFKVRAAPRSEGHFAGGGWQPTDIPFGDHLDPANKAVPVPAGSVQPPSHATCSISDQRESAERFLFFLLRKVFCFGFQRVAGEKPRPVQESLLPPSHPRIPPTSQKTKPISRR